MPYRPPVHRPASGLGSLADAQAGQREYERRRGSARARGYTSEWDAAAKRYLTRHPLCVGCHAVGIVCAAELVDHVEPHKGDMVKFWDDANWQASCRWHHDVVKQKLEARFARGEVAADALRLDGPAARALTLPLRPA